LDLEGGGLDGASNPVFGTSVGNGNGKNVRPLPAITPFFRDFVNSFQNQYVFFE
jgi:hypothetical protein